MVRFEYFEKFLQDTEKFNTTEEFESWYKKRYIHDRNKILSLLETLQDETPKRSFTNIVNTFSSLSRFSNVWYKDEEKCEYVVNTIYDFYNEFIDILEYSDNRNDTDQLIKGYTKILFRYFNNNEWNAIPSILLTEIAATLCPKWYYISSSQIQQVIGLKNVINLNTVKIYIENCKELIEYCSDHNIEYKDDLVRINYLLLYIKLKA